MGSHYKNKHLIPAIAFKLKSLREDFEMSQEDVYNDTGIHISRIETGKANVTVSTLSSLCKYYKISLSDFFIDIE